MWLWDNVRGKMELEISRDEVEALTSRLKSALEVDGRFNVSVRESSRKGYLRISFAYTDDHILEPFTMGAIQEVVAQSYHNYYVSVMFIDTRNFAGVRSPRVTVRNLKSENYQTQCEPVHSPQCCICHYLMRTL
jgi:hypothetical protein